MIEPRLQEAAPSPHRLFIYGKPKVGKTTAIAALPKHLIIDTEIKGTKDGVPVGGTSFCTGAYSVIVGDLPTLREVHKYITAQQDKFDFIVIDTIDHIEAWVTEEICAKHRVQSIGDLPHGKGWAMARNQTIAVVETFAKIANKLIIVGHQKDGHGEEQIEVEKVALTGKLKTHLCSIMDGVGRITRNAEGKLMIDFRTGQNTDAGCRIPRLANQLMELNWSEIYPDLIKNN
jgi:hypothetical protein